MTEWAKVYSDILGDPKLMRAARKGHTGLELTPWLLVFAKAAHDGGRLTVNGEPIEPADLVSLIPCSTETSITAALDSLQHLAVLVADDDGALRFATWDERQAKPSDSREAVSERVQRYREKAKREGWASRAVSDSTRQAIFNRDGRKCVKCGSDERLEVDHIMPISKGGSGEWDNLRTLCFTCNRRLNGHGDQAEDGHAPVVTRGHATEVEEEIEEKKTYPPTPLPGADAPREANGNGHRPGAGKHLTLHRTLNASVPVVLNRLTGFLAEVAQQTEREFHRERLRDVMVDLAFAYWAKKTRHDTAKLDRKRAQLLRKRLVEGDDNVHQLLFAVDGALKDDVLMGRKADSSRKYDGISTIYRDWEQVERLAAQGGYVEGGSHAMAVKYLEGAMPMAGVEHGAVAAGN